VSHPLHFVSFALDEVKRPIFRLGDLGQLLEVPHQRGGEHLVQATHGHALHAGHEVSVGAKGGRGTGVATLPEALRQIKSWSKEPESWCQISLGSYLLAKLQCSYQRVPHHLFENVHPSSCESRNAYSANATLELLVLKGSIASYSPMRQCS
jgi:hypothetical protein